MNSPTPSTVQAAASPFGDEFYASLHVVVVDKDAVRWIKKLLLVHALQELLSRLEELVYRPREDLWVVVSHCVGDHD